MAGFELRILLACVFAALAAVLAPAGAATELPLDRIKLPPGFSIALWARADNAREMALGHVDATGGTVFVGSMSAGKVHAVHFGPGYQVREVTTLASGLEMPVGVAYKDGSLYVSA